MHGLLNVNYGKNNVNRPIHSVSITNTCLN